MANKLPKEIPIDRASLRNMKTTDDVIQWLGRFVQDLDEWYVKIRDTFNNAGMETANWEIREATDLDVTNGDAAVAGNLIVIHKTNGRKAEHEA